MQQNNYIHFWRKSFISPQHKTMTTFKILVGQTQQLAHKEAVQCHRTG